MEMAGASGFNSIEITEIAARRWVGLYHATVVAHPRHLHPTPFLQDPDTLTSTLTHRRHRTDLLEGGRSRAPGQGNLAQVQSSTQRVTQQRDNEVPCLLGSVRQGA
jgi:hypothetical protein